jgi:hypothetical protein
MSIIGATSACTSIASFIPVLLYRFSLICESIPCFGYVAVFIYTLPWGRLPPLLVPIFLQADHASSFGILAVFRVAVCFGSLDKVGDVLDGERRYAYCQSMIQSSQEYLQMHTEVEQDTSGKSAVDGLRSESLLLLELLSGGRGRCYKMVRIVVSDIGFLRSYRRTC